MKKLTITLAFGVAALLTAGMARHPENPLTVAGQAIAMAPAPVTPNSAPPAAIAASAPKPTKHTKRTSAKTPKPATEDCCPIPPCPPDCGQSW